LVAWWRTGFSGSVVYGFDLFRERSFGSAPSLASGLWRESITPVMSLVPGWSSNEGPLVIAGARRWCWCCRIPPFFRSPICVVLTFSSPFCEPIGCVSPSSFKPIWVKFNIY
ncbi:unnamed protein product, partial [Arabidopsis halleri]